jgi:hypothetical protein
MSDKTYINSQGACYLAVNFLGWATARTPWEALAKLDLNANGKRVTVGTKAYAEQTEDATLYYLPDESKFKGTNYYSPVDGDGKPYGIPLYGGLSEHNELVIKKTLGKAR